jgi:hypothetical protein
LNALHAPDDMEAAYVGEVLGEVQELARQHSPRVIVARASLAEAPPGL